MLHRACLLAVSLVAALLPIWPGAGQDNAIMDAYLGRWLGSVTEIDPSNQYPVTVSLVGGPIGSIIGTVEYPMCGSDVTLVSVSPDDILAAMCGQDLADIAVDPRSSHRVS